MPEISLQNIDCLEGLKGIPDNSIDLVLTDPPFGISFQSSWKIKRKRFRLIKNDNKPFTEWINPVYEKIKPGGVLVVFYRWDVQQEFKSAIEKAGFKIHSQIVWDKIIHGLGNLSGAFAPQHELAFFATKGKFKFKHGRPKTILRHQRVSPEKMIHPCEKPVSLFRELIRKLTDKGQLVCDLFLGSGSCAIASEKEGRNFIGFELDSEYYEAAKKRFEAHAAQLQMF